MTSGKNSVVFGVPGENSAQGSTPPPTHSLSNLMSPTSRELPSPWGAKPIRGSSPSVRRVHEKGHTGERRRPPRGSPAAPTGGVQVRGHGRGTRKESGDRGAHLRVRQGRQKVVSKERWEEGSRGQREGWQDGVSRVAPWRRRRPGSPEAHTRASASDRPCDGRDRTGLTGQSSASTLRATRAARKAEGDPRAGARCFMLCFRSHVRITWGLCAHHQGYYSDMQRQVPAGTWPEGDPSASLVQR